MANLTFYCRVCGEILSEKRNFCSTVCAEKGLTIAKNKPISRNIQVHGLLYRCAVCGKIIKNKRRTIFCSTNCYIASKRIKRSIQEEDNIDSFRYLSSLKNLNRRKCHDCGKLTSNYRCPKCLSKWRDKHHVSQSDLKE